MNIKSTLYAHLTPSQRLAATFGALGRNDESEFQRLCETCPLMPYDISDPKFANIYQSILFLALQTEYNLLQFAFKYQVSANDDPQMGVEYLRLMASLDAAWKACLSEHGIRWEGVQAVKRRNSVVAKLLDDRYIDDKQLAEDSEYFKTFLEAC